MGLTAHYDTCVLKNSPHRPLCWSTAQIVNVPLVPAQHCIYHHWISTSYTSCITMSRNCFSLLCFFFACCIYYELGHFCVLFLLSAFWFGSSIVPPSPVLTLPRYSQPLPLMHSLLWWFFMLPSPVLSSSTFICWKLVGSLSLPKGKQGETAAPYFFSRGR